MLTSALLLAGLGTAGSAPNESVYSTEFLDVDGNHWSLVSGNISFTEANGWAGDKLSWLVLEDNDDYDGARPSRVRASAPAVNTTLASYTIHAVVERDHTYIAPGQTAPTPGFFGIAFGDNGNGYYMAGFNTAPNGTEVFHLSVPNGTSGEFDMVHRQWDWGNVPSWINDTNTRHRYTLEVDGTTIGVKVDGWDLGQYTLTGVAAGTFGLVAGENTRIYVEQMFYEPLDRVGPTIEFWRPADATLYVHDQPIGIPATGFTAAIGELTVGADIFDDVTGPKKALLYVDGQYVPGATVADPGIKTQWTIDTTGLSIGMHTLTVRAFDYAGNMAEESTDILIIGANVDGRTVAFAQDTVATVVGELPEPPL